MSVCFVSVKPSSYVFIIIGPLRSMGNKGLSLRPSVDADPMAFFLAFSESGSSPCCNWTASLAFTLGVPVEGLVCDVGLVPEQDTSNRSPSTLLNTLSQRAKCSKSQLLVWYSVWPLYAQNLPQTQLLMKIYNLDLLFASMSLLHGFAPSDRSLSSEDMVCFCFSLDPLIRWAMGASWFVWATGLISKPVDSAVLWRLSVADCLW